MRINLQIIIAFILLSISGIAQDRNWKTQKSSDGKVTVKSDVVDTDEGNIIYYISTTTGNISLAQAESYVRNSSNYKNFLERTAESKELKKLSTNAWISYCYFDAPWPLSNSDVVQKFTYTKTPTGFEISGSAISSKYAPKDVPRVQINNITYIFNKKTDSTLEVTIKSNFETLENVPEWMLNSWFPQGPADIIQNLILGASKE